MSWGCRTLHKCGSILPLEPVVPSFLPSFCLNSVKPLSLSLHPSILLFLFFFLNLLFSSGNANLVTLMEGMLTSSFTYTHYIHGRRGKILLKCMPYSASIPKTCRYCHSYLGAVVLIRALCTHTVIMLHVHKRCFSLFWTTIPVQSEEESCLRLGGWSRQAWRRRRRRGGRGRTDPSWRCVFFFSLPAPPAAPPSASALLGRSSWCLKRTRSQNVGNERDVERSRIIQPSMTFHLNP